MKYSKINTPRIAALKKLECPSDWIENPIVTVGVVMLLAAADGLNLWAAFDKVLTESIGVLIGIVLAFALCLEGIPVLTSRLIMEVIYSGWSRFRKIMLALLLVGFLIVVGFAAYVKIAARDLMLSSATVGLVNSAVSNAVTEVSSDSKDGAYLAATIAMAALPLATSILAFYLGWLSSDPVKTAAKKHRLYIAEMKERQVILSAQRAELGAPDVRRNFLIQREKELYADALNQNGSVEALVQADTVEAFFVGKTADELTTIAARKTATANYEPKESSLAIPEEEYEITTQDHAQDKVRTIPILYNN